MTVAALLPRVQRGRQRGRSGHCTTSAPCHAVEERAARHDEGDVCGAVDADQWTVTLHWRFERGLADGQNSPNGEQDVEMFKCAVERGWKVVDGQVICSSVDVFDHRLNGHHARWREGEWRAQ